MVPAVMMTDVDNDMEKVDFSGRNPKIDGTGIFSGSQFTTNIFFALFWASFNADVHCYGLASAMFTKSSFCWD